MDDRRVALDLIKSYIPEKFQRAKINVLNQSDVIGRTESVAFSYLCK